MSWQNLCQTVAKVSVTYKDLIGKKKKKIIAPTQASKHNKKVLIFCSVKDNRLYSWGFFNTVFLILFI